MRSSQRMLGCCKTNEQCSVRMWFLGRQRSSEKKKQFSEFSCLNGTQQVVKFKLRMGGKKNV